MKLIRELLWAFCAYFFGLSALIAQDLTTQTVSGKVLDKETKQPLIGVTITVKNSEPLLGASSDINGEFKLENVPVGRQVIEAQYVGYATYMTDNLIINSAKETYLEIEMSEKVETTGEVVVTASSSSAGGSQPLNELSVVSTRSFSVEETQRYAASINDPGRMAMAFPGVQSNQDSENDIVIRGNSSVGLLWRLEGLDIPNPNHFARSATSGGGLTVFSSALLGNSDFSTGAFAAEYGNAFSGVFDMRFRKGNLTNREYTAKVGLIGLDFATEGPIKKGRSSYLVNYRYSTLGLLNLAGLYVVRENVGNNFQDLSFNLYFSSPDNRNQFTVFGVGGMSTEEWLTKPDTADWITSLDYVSDKNGSNLGILGMTYTRLLNEKSYLKVVAGGVLNHTEQLQVEPDISDQSIRDTLQDFDYKTLRSSLALTYSYKFNSKFRIKSGLTGQAITYWLNYDEYVNSTVGLHTFLDERGTTFQAQAYAQGSYKPLDKLTINFGFHALYLAQNHSYSIEPRAAIRYQATKSTVLSLAYGLHGRVLPIGTYMLRLPNATGTSEQLNKDLGVAKSHHAVLSLQQMIGKSLRVTSEFYYQYQFGVPVGVDSATTYWFFNERDNYGTRQMVSEGYGQNYGLDLSVEKFFGKSFFLLCSGSVFWSQYKTSKDGKWRSTRTDNRYNISLMGGYEYTFKKGGVLQFGLKSFIVGGLRYTPIDESASRVVGGLVPINELAFTEEFPIYFRLDARIAYRKDHKKLSYTIALDLQNATNMKNIKEKLYDRQAAALINRYHSGILPVVSFQIDF
ncbi:MAG: TonB-dependent receptor [Aureispira sp.]|nr:TonB-dependent receptor [Aureispira sp.]